MSFNILNHIYSALFVFSIVVFFEVLFSLKKNKGLKIILLTYIAGVLFYCAANIYCSYTQFNRVLLGLPIPFLAITSILLLSMLCHNKIKTYIIIFSSLIIVCYLSLLIYFSLIKPVNFSISLSNNDLLGNYLNYIKFCIIIVVSGITIRKYTHMMKKYSADNIYFIAIRKWVIFFMICISILFFAILIKVVFGDENLISKYLIAISFFISVIGFLFRPKFVNHSLLSISLGKSYFNKKTDTEISKVTFADIFFTQLYFLNADASLEDFSKKLETSSEDLYRYIYKNYNYGFNDLINENRVKYFTQVVKSKKYSNYTIDALSQMAGFRSRHHLYKPFKKFHGGVPSDFLKSLDYNV